MLRMVAGGESDLITAARVWNWLMPDTLDAGGTAPLAALEAVDAWSRCRTAMATIAVRFEPYAATHSVEEITG